MSAFGRELILTTSIVAPSVGAGDGKYLTRAKYQNPFPDSKMILVPLQVLTKICMAPCIGLVVVILRVQESKQHAVANQEF